MSGQWHPPQTEHSGGPLGDPSARVFEVFLTVSQYVAPISQSVIPPLRGWYNRDSLCYGIGARMADINEKMQKKMTCDRDDKLSALA